MRSRASLTGVFSIGFVHSAFTFAYESLLNRSNVRNVEKSVPPGALISFLQKGLQYVGIEESLQRDGTGTGRKAKGSKKREREMPTNGEHADFTLLAPRTMSALHRQDPPIRLNVPPATAAAAFKARMDAEAKMDAETTAKVLSKPSESSSANDARSKSQPSSIPTQQSLADESSFAKSSVAAHTADAHTAASVMSQLQQLAGPPGTQRRSLDQDIALHQQKNLVVSNSRHGGVVSSQTATAAETLAMVGQVVPPEQSGKAGSNGAQRPAFDASAPQLQGGSSNARFGPRQEALSRIEAKSRKDGTRDGVAPMEVDKSTQPLQQVPVHNYANGMSSRGMDQNGQPVLSSNMRGSQQNSSGAQTSSQRQQQNSEEDMPIPKSRADEIDQEDLSTRASPDEVLYLRKHSSEVFMCAWNPVFTDLIATGSGDASARIWQMGGSEAKSGFVTTRELPHVTPSADRKNKDVTTLEWSSDGNLLATGSYDGVARVWSRTGVLVHTLSKHRGPIFSLKWNKRGDYLLSGSYDQSTIVWDVSGVSGRVVQQFFDHKAPALDVDWKDDTTFASCSTDQRVLICRVGVERALKVYEGHEDEVNAVKWDPSGTLLASCSDDYTAKVWDVASDQKEPLHDFKRHKAEIYTLKW